MIRTIKQILGLFLLLCAVGFLHYTLPQRDIVRIAGTEVFPTDVSGLNALFYAQSDSGGGVEVGKRSLRLINTVRANGDTMVYRNEDTGLFNWPPYIKTNSSDVQAEAADAVSPKDVPQWMIVRHYGWRITWLSIYPNALSVKPASGPDQQLIPWFNIIFLTILMAIFWAIFVRIRRFWNGRIEPVLDHAEARVDETRETVGGWFRRKK
ncbi:MAG: DUF1523 family protein [Planktomarina sp.]